jgi:hypothetical protein
MGLINLSTQARNAMLQALCDQGPVTIEIYGGIGGMPPPTADDPVMPSDTLFGTLTFSSPPADPPVNGVLTFSSITAAPSCLATGIAVWGRVKDAAGNTLLDGDVRQDGTGMFNFSTSDFVAGGPIILTSFILQIPTNIYF